MISLHYRKDNERYCWTIQQQKYKRIQVHVFRFWWITLYIEILSYISASRANDFMVYYGCAQNSFIYDIIFENDLLRN